MRKKAFTTEDTELTEVAVPGARWAFSALIAAVFVGAVAACGVAVAQAAGYGFDLQGRPVGRVSSAGNEAVVLFFLATDCPISNRYVPEIRRLEAEFAGKPVAFWLVYPNATESAAGIARHQAEFGLRGATLMKPSAMLLGEAGVRVTPEAVVLMPIDSDLRPVYAGRIDDLYVDIGKQRAKATRHDLEQAIVAGLAHRPILQPGGPPVGCGIVSRAMLGQR